MWYLLFPLICIIFFAVLGFSIRIAFYFAVPSNVYYTLQCYRVIYPNFDIFLYCSFEVVVDIFNIAIGGKWELN